MSACMFLSRGVSSTNKPDRSCGGAYLVPLIISIPSLIRLRQCLIEFFRVRKAGQTAVSGWGGNHLANALKYSSAFPVIILSALQRGYDPQKIGTSEAGLFRLWYPHITGVFLVICLLKLQALRCFSKFVLLILLGHRQRLGSHALFLLCSPQQSGTSMGPSSPHPFPFERDVLCSYNYRPYASLYLEF